jgi:hypothetical protein
MFYVSGVWQWFSIFHRLADASRAADLGYSEGALQAEGDVTPRKFKIEENLKPFINCKLNQMSYCIHAAMHLFLYWCIALVH